MAKKPVTTPEEIELVIEPVPTPIETNFGRDDLNQLRDVVNFLLSRLK